MSDVTDNGAEIDDTTDEKEIRIPSRIANMIRAAHTGKPDSKTIIIDRAWFDSLVSTRTRSNDEDRTDYLRALLLDFTPDSEGTYVIPAIRLAAPGSPFPQSAYTNASYWSGASQAGAVTAFRVGAYAASLKMSLVGETLVPQLTLSKMSDEKIAEFEEDLAELEAKRTAAKEKTKADKADSAPAS